MMLFYNVIILFFIQIYLFSFSKSENITNSYNVLFNKIIQMFTDHVSLREVIEEFFSNKNNKKCIDYIRYFFKQNGFIINDKIRKLYDIIYKSGIIDLEIGFENACLNDYKYSYFFLSMNEPVNIKYKNSKEYPYGKDYRDFIEDKIFTKEFCVTSNCYDAMLLFFNKSINKLFFNSLEKVFGFNDLKIYDQYFNSEGKKKIKHNIKNDTSFEIMIKILFYILSIRIFFTIIHIMLNQDEKQENEFDYKLIEEQNNKFIQNPVNYNKSICEILSQNLSIFENISLILKKNNHLFNNKDITPLNLIIFINLFFIMISQCSYYFIIDKRIGTSLINIIDHKFFIIKITILSIEFYKILSGILCGFKLMSYLKRFKNKTYSIFIFFLYSIPYILTFFFIFFFIETFSMEYGNYISPTLRFQYKIENYMKKAECFSKNYFLFYPLTGYIDPKYGYNTSCNRIILFTLTEFYSFCYLLIILSLLFKIRNKKFDLVVYIINFILIIFFYFTSEEKEYVKTGEDFTISKIFGSTENISFLPFFFPLYFIGFNIGVMYFYFINTTIFINNKDADYLPFNYNLKLLKFFDSMNQVVRYFLMCLSIFFIFCLSYIYPYYRRNNFKLTIQSNSVLQFFYVYESIFTGLFFSFFICCYLFNKNLTSNVLQSEFFVIISRISFISFNLCNVIPNLFFTLSLIQIFMNYKNIIIISIVLFGINIISSMIVAIIVFIPIRIVIKKILERKTEIKNKIEF